MLMPLDSGVGADSGGGIDGFFGDAGDVYMDMDSFNRILKEEAPDPSQSNSHHQPINASHDGGSAAGVGGYDKSVCHSDASCCPATDELSLSFSGGISSENSNKTMEDFRKHPCTSLVEISLRETGKVTASGSCSEPGVSHVPEPDYIDRDRYAAMVECWREDHEIDDFMPQTVPTSGKMLNFEHNEIDSLQPLFSYLDQIVLPDSKSPFMDKSVSDVSTTDLLSQNTAGQEFSNGDFVNPVGIDLFSGSSPSTTDASSEQFMFQTQIIKKDEAGGEHLFSNAMNYDYSQKVPFAYPDNAMNYDHSRKASFAYADKNVAEDMLTMFHGNQNLAVAKKEENEVLSNSKWHPFAYVVPNDKCMELSLGLVENSFPSYWEHDSDSFKKELDIKSAPMIVKSTSVQPKGGQVSSANYASDADDLCILEDISHPVTIVPAVSLQSYTAALNLLNPRTPENNVSVGASRLKPRDERSVFREALQDLSQPTLEANPPDGSLAVPLLRHQRIALRWMVQKETAGGPCSGGILADDQGLGKTISTLALIVSEKPSSGRVPVDIGNVELESLDVDEDVDKVSKSDIVKKNGIALVRNGNEMKSKDISSLSRGRPAAGTLIVCPTSVIRQWAEELRSKVTKEASLSVLLYHGSHRTKDPYDLAKYDVVLTTYSIVSMEVPRQTLKGKDDDDKRNLDSDSVHLPSSKKRKRPPSSDRKRLKRGAGDALRERSAYPLAVVRWFRVVLDEAQSIKNHKTRAAQACWGLRAKRRWCLSGTPIQNAVDDLYSYFRFLKYDPYDVYQSFVSYIKAPIGKSPAKGYKKLQAILKTVMLRRTKGTLLEGKPIICLPPKSVELKKVEFSKEERDFYSKLEADSRAQFQDYAASGTVQLNYVNILLLLLRLRQACDHPLLVHQHDSSTVWESSVKEATKFPLEKLHFLLSRLEASLAICGICSDPPEDAVVSICGHVFCNQCISEHLSGDNNECPARTSDHLSQENSQCPALTCKAQLSSSSVFSDSVLNSCLSNQTSEVISASSSGSCQSSKPWLAGRLSDSSKIRAALEILHSLSKPQDHIAITCSTEHNDSGPSSSECSQSRGDIADSYDDKIPCVEAQDKDRNTSFVVSEKAIVQDGNTATVVSEKAIVFAQDKNTASVVSEKAIAFSQDKNTASVVSEKAIAFSLDKNTASVVSEKAIVFSQWTRMLDLLEGGLKESTIQYRRLDGTMSVAARDKAVRDFNTLPEVTVIIMSLKAASLGLNMVAASRVLLLDPWWNPTTEDQAIDRAHRIGQTRPVTVFRLTVKDTVEDRILALQQKKREMVASAFGEDETGSRQTRLTVEDLNYLFMV